MIAVYGIMGVVIVMVIILQYLKSNEYGGGSVTAAGLQTQRAELWKSRGATPKATVATADRLAAKTTKNIVNIKEIIMARSQRRLYGFNGDEINVEDSRWAHDLMTSWCTKLDDYMTNVLFLERTVNVLNERIETVVEKYLVNFYMCS